MIIINETLLKEFGIKFKNSKELISYLQENVSKGNTSSFAQAYAGHQFVYFTKLGDRRAVILGEYKSSLKKRFDIQLKGSGKTKYSRGEDEKATLKTVLREYLLSEAMHH